jgi:hypothetical protein
LRLRWRRPTADQWRYRDPPPLSRAHCQRGSWGDLVRIFDELVGSAAALGEYYGIRDYEGWRGDDETRGLGLPDEAEDAAAQGAAPVIVRLRRGNCAPPLGLPRPFPGFAACRSCQITRPADDLAPRARSATKARQISARDPDLARHARRIPPIRNPRRPSAGAAPLPLPGEGRKRVHRAEERCRVSFS